MEVPIDVIVIGAGIAGLAAAVELSKANMEFIVLEARNRLGGRIYVKNLPNGRKIHLGANWIHEAHDNNPLYNFCKRYYNIFNNFYYSKQTL